MEYRGISDCKDVFSFFFFLMKMRKLSKLVGGGNRRVNKINNKINKKTKYIERKK